MAPLAADPHQLLVVFDDPKRRAFFNLVQDVIDSMRSHLELGNAIPYNEHKSPSPGPSPAPTDTSREAKAGHQEETLEVLHVADPDADADKDTPARQPQPKKLQKRPEQPGGELVALRRDALKHFDDWRNEIMKKLREILTTKEDKKILEARAKRQEEISKLRSRAADKKEENLISIGTTENSGTSNAQDVTALQVHYHPVPSRLATLPVEDRREALSCMLLIMLSTGHYSAHSRALALYLTSSLELPLGILITEETEIADYMLEAASGKDITGGKKSDDGSGMSGDAEAAKRRKENQTARFWKVGLASVAGAAVIGVTGGLAAPVVAGAIGGLMGGLGLGGVASFLGIFWANGALVGTLFGAFGAKMTGEMMDAYAKEVNDFRFIPLKDEEDGSSSGQPADSPKEQKQKSRRLRVTIGVNGWLKEEDDVTKPWCVLGNESEVFGLRYEMKALLALGSSLEGLAQSYAWKYVKMEILKKTVLASLTAVLWPAYLLSTASNIDNPFNLARNRSEKAGRVLADALINRAQGERPVTLVGYSLGARAIYSCLQTLAERRAFGLVDNVVLIGAPTPSDTAHWQVLRSVVSGRIFNVFSENDYILGFLYRATSLQYGIAGLQPVVRVPGIENLDLSQEVAGHLRYPDLIAQILTRCGFPDIKGGEDAIEREEDLDAAQQMSFDDLPPEARAIHEDVSGQAPQHKGEGDDEGPRPPLPLRPAQVSEKAGDEKESQPEPVRGDS